VSNGSWSYTSASLAAGSNTFSAVATDLAGNTSTASDAAFSIAAPALTIVYSSGVDTSTTTRTVSSTTPVRIASTGSDTITLAIAEDAYLGDAEFTVSVDGKQIGGVQTATALHSAGLSQNFTLQGNFGAGTHVVSVDFLNDAVAVYSNGAVAGDRNLYVDSITGDGVTTIENVEENLAGTTNYTITLPKTSAANTKPAAVAPLVTLAVAPSASSGSMATLGTAVAGNSGDTLTVRLVSDADFKTGSALALANGSLIYTPGTITAANAGTDTISYIVTDSTNGLTTTETQKVTLVAPAIVKPTITIASQVLAKDTGASAADDVTSDGAVTLTGTVTGATGTVVTILDGTTLLGTATIASGKWTFGATLSAGTHTLHAVATDPFGNSVASAAEPTITVDTAAPALTIAVPVQIAGTTEVTLSGKVTDATATTVQIKDGSTVLGNATVSNGSWSYTSASLAAGSNTFSAVATDLAGNTSTASDAAFTITTPVVSTPDEVLATVSTGTGTTQEEVDLSSATPIIGTFVPVSTSGIGTNPLVLYNWHPATQLQGFLASQKAGIASIVGIGDSFTDGFGSATTGWSQLSYLNEMTQALKQDGIAAQSNNFLGSEFYITNGLVDDNRLTPVGYPTTSTYYDGGFTIVAGGNAIYLDGAGKGFNFQLDTPGNYNEVTVSYVDVGSGSVGLTVNGVTVGSMTFGNTGETLTQTVKIPAGSYSDLVVKSTSANPVYIQGAAFSSTTNPAIQVYNAGIGGWDSNNANTSVYLGQTITGSANGFGETASAAALKPSLALIDLGSNDIALGEDTPAQTVANIAQIVATLKAAGTDVIIMIPQPFGSAAYATDLPAVRAGLEAYSLANNVPLIDLSATYDNSEADLEAAGLKSDLLHGDATFYADIGSQLASLLTTTITKAASSGTTAAAAATVETTKIAAANALAVIDSNSSLNSSVDNVAVTASAAPVMDFVQPASSTASGSTTDLFATSKADLFADGHGRGSTAYLASAGTSTLMPIENTLPSMLGVGAALTSHLNALLQYSAKLAHVSHSAA
jgi:lysophospholipase L1-like esterase